MPLSKSSLLPALGVCCIAIPCVAQDTRPGAFNEIVVTASRVPQPLRRVGTSLSVLDAGDLQLRGNLALQDLLRQTPAVSVSGTGGAGKTSTLRIRGEEGYRTLVILDGIRLLDPSGPQIGPQFEHILTSGLGRVEILRGPQGLGYGADAGGVVNMSSLPATQELNLSVDVQAGAFDTQQYSATLSGGTERSEFALLLTDLQSDGFNAQTADTVLRDDDGYANTTIHARAGFALSDSLRLDLTHREVRGDAAFDGCLHPVTFATEHDCTNNFELDASRAALNYSGARVTHTLSYATTDTDRDSLTLGQSTFASAGALDRWEYLGYAGDLPGFALVFGADHEDARDNAVGRANVGVFTELLSEFSDTVHVGAGVRHDDNDDFGTNTSYRVSGTWLVDAGASGTLKFKGSHGTGFRAPSPFEIAYNGGTWSYPPASMTVLQQETSAGYEAGVEYLHDGGLHLNAVYFTQDIEDAIYFDLVTYSGYLQYAGNSTSRGVELSGDLPLSAAVQLHANYTWNETALPNGMQRPRRPEHQFNAGASWTLQKGLMLSAFYRAARSAIDEVPAGIVALDDFGVLDISASVQLAERMQVYGRIENLLDEQYEELSGYNSADRAAYIGFRFSYR